MSLEEIQCIQESTLVKLFLRKYIIILLAIPTYYVVPLYLSLSRGGVTLTFIGENFDVVGQPLFVYTASSRSVRSSPAWVHDRLFEIVCQ